MFPRRRGYPRGVRRLPVQPDHPGRGGPRSTPCPARTADRDRDCSRPAPDDLTARCLNIGGAAPIGALTRPVGWCRWSAPPRADRRWSRWTPVVRVRADGRDPDGAVPQAPVPTDRPSQPGRNGAGHPARTERGEPGAVSRTPGAPGPAAWPRAGPGAAAAPGRAHRPGSATSYSVAGPSNAFRGAGRAGHRPPAAQLPGPDEAGQSAPNAARAPDAARRNPQQARRDDMSRNAPCPCGSGRKYKQCHGAPARG